MYHRFLTSENRIRNRFGLVTAFTLMFAMQNILFSSNNITLYHQEARLIDHQMEEITSKKNPPEDGFLNNAHLETKQSIDATTGTKNLITPIPVIVAMQQQNVKASLRGVGNIGEDEEMDDRQLHNATTPSQNVTIQKELSPRNSSISENITNITSTPAEEELFVIPYMESELERKYIQQIHALPHASSNGKKVISISVYGNDPKYTRGAIANAKLQKTYFPGWSIRFYVLPSFSEETVKEMKELGAEVVYPPEDMRDIQYGLLWRFLAADDPEVERFISRDSDSRLNARERFAVEEWLQSGKSCHGMQDHPYHGVLLNGGLWGIDTKVFKSSGNSSLQSLLREFLRDGGCNDINNRRASENYDCDNLFLAKVIWPMVEHDQMGHSSFSCKSYPNGIGFPTPRDQNYQFVGQVFDENDMPRKRDFKPLKGNRGQNNECFREGRLML